MVNSLEFSNRLQLVMDYYQETASSFAEKIGVQRSSISHILSGRNKPSLDFVMKVLSSFPEVELYWLLNGKGSFPDNTSNEDKLPSEEMIQKVMPSENKPSTLESTISKVDEKKIKRIVIFYNDGTFENFESN